MPGLRFVVLALLALAAACEFNRDGLRCEPRIPVGGRCGFALSPDEAPVAPPTTGREPRLVGSFPEDGCARESACEAFGSATCVTLPGLGQPCSTDGRCVRPLACDFESFSCQEGGREGASCASRPCAPGHRCLEGICRLGERFSPCSQSTECPAEHFCEPSATRSCLPRRGLGEACESSEACTEPAICSVDGVCRAPLAAGDPCRDACGPALFCTSQAVSG